MAIQMTFIYNLLFVLTLILAPSPSRADSPAVSSTLRVIDGRTLSLDGRVFRLAGIDTPDPGQPCQWPKKTINCGNIARTALLDLVAGAIVTCRPLADASDGAARCSAGGFDVGANMVHTGWAVATADAPDAYRRNQQNAKAARRGLWQGTFEMPAAWRQRR